MTFLRLRWLLPGVLSCLLGCGDAQGSSLWDAGASDGATDMSMNGSDASADSGWNGNDGSIAFDAGGDSGTSSADAGYFGTSSLQLEGFDPNYPIELVPGQAVRLTARALGASGLPDLGAQIDFALLGKTEGSTLSAIFGFADANGLVSFYLQAGLDAAAFQVRITSSAGVLYVPIVVKTTTLEDVEVSLATGVLGLVSDASVQAFAGFDCDAVVGVPPSAGDTFDGSGIASLDSLATTINYAVVATATVTGGAEVQQCVSGVVPGRTTVAPFDFGLIDPPVSVP